MHTALFFSLCSRGGCGYNTVLRSGCFCTGTQGKICLCFGGCLGGLTVAIIGIFGFRCCLLAVYFLLRVLCQICASNMILGIFNKLCKEATMTSADFTCLLSHSSVSSRRLKCIQISIWLSVSALNKPSLLYPTPFTYIAKHSIQRIS